MFFLIGALFTTAEDLSGMPQTTSPRPPLALLLLMFLQDERFFWMTYTSVSQYLPQNANFKGKKVTEES